MMALNRYMVQCEKFISEICLMSGCVKITEVWTLKL